MPMMTTARRLLLALLLAAAAPPALASTCVPAPWGQGSKALTGVNEVGAWAAWHCDDGYSVIYALYAVRWDAVTPALRADFSRLSDAANMSVAIAEMAGRHATVPIGDARLAAVYADSLARIAAASPPQRVWAVAKNGLAVDRPAYPYGADGRGRYSKARALVGAPCDVGVRFVEGATVYAKVAEGLVAVCKGEQGARAAP